MIALSHRVSAAAAVPVAPLLYRLLTVFRLYTTAGAAQPQLDPDYYYYNDNSNYRERSRNRLAKAPMADSESSVPRRGVHWAFIGYPRIKKRMYVERLSELLEVPYISMASLVRQELNPGTSLYKQEILDELAKIDLVVNFKCTDDFLIKNQEGAWKDKLQAYIEQSKPLEEYYRKQKNLLDFQVVGAPRETWQGLLAALRLEHINAVNCSKKLTSGYTLL
ncbi:probable adenylate kinase 7, mitochondrial isoform X5 [Hevea brasiliensis]|uniref:probable adenylate kinase 7, mitochondrial isoform X5 n=1 Tax=Hevea brasiliensis TaxID=3981 RepID=UPI0025F355E6|nr:probable adenylate kinase 7, mitochondrial isoform X5 [Hevea brasiliensis]